MSEIKWWHDMNGACPTGIKFLEKLGMGDNPMGRQKFSTFDTPTQGSSSRPSQLKTLLPAFVACYGDDQGPNFR